MTTFVNLGKDEFFGANRKPISAASMLIVAGERIGILLTMLLDWQDRARQRRQLLALGERALQDFGRSRADAVGEGDKRFWTA